MTDADAAADDAPRSPSRARSLTLRYLTFFLGVFIMSFGVALSVHAIIGTTPISAIPLVLAFATPVSVGTYVIGINAVLLTAQILILRRKFEPIQLLQLPAAIAFGAACDLALWLTSGYAPTTYPEQLGLSLLGSVVLGIGVWLQVTPKVLMLPGDGISVVISRVTGREFGGVKILMDSLLVVIAIVLSFILLGELRGVREGTVIAAILVGWIVRQLQRRVPWPRILSP